MKAVKENIKKLEKLEIKVEEQKHLKGGERLNFNNNWSIFNCW